MSGLQARADDTINGVDVREQGSALRVATNTPHLVSLGTGRLSTAVTLHPIKQGRVTIGSDPTCDIYVVGTGVASVHCRVENSHGVVTLYPVAGSTLLDNLSVDKPTRLSQGSMLTIGRSNYLRFNHPAEAKLMKSVLPSAHVSMSPIQFSPDDQSYNTESQYQNNYNSLSQLDQQLDASLKELSRTKPPVAPKKGKEFDSDDEKPKMTSIMAKVSKFEYYAKQNKNVGRSQFYTQENDISPKVFSSNSLTVNTPAKDVLGGKTVPNYIKNKPDKVIISENNAIDAKKCSYANVAIRNNTKIGDIVKNFDDSSKLKKVNNDQVRDNVYGKINTDRRNDDKYFESKQTESIHCFETKNNFETDLNSKSRHNFETEHHFETKHNLEQINSVEAKNDSRKEQNDVESSRSEFGKINGKITLPSPAFDRNPQYAPVYSQYERNMEAEHMRMKAYQERVKEEEKKEAEMERLEEILDIFTEYQKQLTSDFRAGIPITPTEKRSHNKIITNGSLPRSVAFNNPNFVKTSEGYYKFETSQSNSLSKMPRNVSSYENFDSSLTPEVTITDNNYENVGRMDEIGIPVFDHHKSPSPTPYENVYKNVYPLKPQSPKTNSPRSRIKTSFAHKNVAPQYFIFPTPPPVDDNKKPNFDLHNKNSSKTDANSRAKDAPNNHNDNVTKDINRDQVDTKLKNIERNANIDKDREAKDKGVKDVNRDQIDTGKKVYERNVDTNAENRKEVKCFNRAEIDAKKKAFDRQANKNTSKEVKKCEGIEKQLSLQEIPMIDEVANDIEFRYSQINDTDSPKLYKNQSFEDVKQELMADIPELEAFEHNLKENREKIINNISEDIKTMSFDEIDNTILDVNIDELKTRYEKLKEDRRKLVTEIHEIKCKMTQIRAQEDDILRELEMEKALIKGEYDSEIAILNIEQKKKADLVDKIKKIEEEIKQLKEKQESRQNEMRDRVEIATLKVERLEQDIETNAVTIEELQNAQDILDNETKLFEDLEFQHLEEESELLANREDLQNDIILLTKKIEAQKTRILTLKSEANNNLTSALDETKVLHGEYVKQLNLVEDLTAKVQVIEKELKPIVLKLNEIERSQSPDSAFYTDQTRTKSGEFGYSPQTSDSDDVDLKNFEEHSKEMKDKFNSIDQMSQSMTVDIEKKLTESPAKAKKGFWERNFDSLKRKKKPKSPEKVDVMSQSLNENLFFNNENIENVPLDRFSSLRNSKKKDRNGPVKSSSSSKIPTFAALGKIMKKDSLKRKDDEVKTRYIKNSKPLTENKYKSKSASPDKVKTIEEADNKILHRKSCGDEPNVKEFNRISDNSKIPSQDDIDRISKVTIDAPILSSDDVNSLGKRTLDSLMEIERKRLEMLEEQGCQMIENEREKISELKRRVQDETKKMWDQKSREKSIESDQFNSLTDDQNENEASLNLEKEHCQQNKENYKFNLDLEKERCENDVDNSKPSLNFERSNQSFDQSDSFERSERKDRERSVTFEDSREKRIDFDRSVIESLDFDQVIEKPDRSFERHDDSSFIDDSFMSSTIFEESSGVMSSSIEELQVRNSRTESTEDEKRSDDSRPLSHASDFSRDNILSVSNAPRRSRGAVTRGESQRPLTRYLPSDRDDFDLRRHVDSAGHQVELCPYVTLTSTSCRGYLHKLGAKFHTWSKRWFVFDRESKTFVYYWDKSEKKPRGGAYFQVIEEVYLDHGNTSRSPSPSTTFIVKTRQRRYCLMAASGPAARIWIDVIFTGAQGYTDYLD